MADNIPDNATMLDYFRTIFPDYDLSAPSGANDGTTEGDVLAEIPFDSAVGDDSKTAIDAASTLVGQVRMAFGDDKPHHIRNIITAAVDSCLCFMRG
jgi:hypothetical protein